MSILLALALLGAPEDVALRLASEDLNEAVAACREAASLQEPALTAPLVRLLRHDNQAVRRAAIEALALRKPPEERKRAAQALAQRIAPLVEAKEEGREECIAVAKALHDLAQPVALKALVDGIGPDADREVTRARLLAVANIPSKEAIDELLHVGSTGRIGAEWRVAAVIAALRYATQENIKGGIDGWRSWWTANRKTYDPALVANKRADARLEEQARRRKAKKGAGGGKGE